ncbi:MAG: phosphoribosylformylglycinamidine synthase subunit PurQ [Candidatus Ancillula trichonymphae]|jgi:phosphoribosylformylglycinamidine synthase|nr:phosphoribosylformylglycinamidine synthase subunit PurQ [Candidatus Ancillula trichonymphae]
MLNEILPSLTRDRLVSAYNTLLESGKRELDTLIKSGTSAASVVKTHLFDYTLAQAACVRVGIVVFPGTLDEQDAARAVRLAGASPILLWHADSSLGNVDAVILPGGFSYGDYLRCGAISRFAPIMEKVVDAARAGLPVLGICNGFQTLTETHLLPGALARNSQQKFICKEQTLSVVNTQTSWTSDYEEQQIVTFPLKNGEGRFVADEKTINRLEAEGRVVFRYSGNPNGSIANIAGITNEKGNVVGLMPHPEHAVEPGFGTDDGHSSSFKRGVDGLKIFKSLVAKVIYDDLAPFSGASSSSMEV